MKRNILLSVTLTLLACACSNEIDLGFDQEPDLMIMNALLNTNDKEHSVWLGLSHSEDVVNLEDAEVLCYINGADAVEAELVRPEYPSYYTLPYSQYSFTADINPGDEVRLEASRGNLHASATVIAPQKAAVTAIDTVFVEKSPYFISDEKGEGALACRLKLQDIPDQTNYYRLATIYSASCLGNHSLSLKYPIGFGYLKDPILKGRFTPDPNTDTDIALLFGAVGQPNSYCAFRDTEFADDIAEVEIHIHEQYYKLTDSRNLEFPATCGLEFVLLTITQEEYDYISQVDKCLNMKHMNALEEAVRIPSNVEGGLGFVSVASAATLTLQYDGFYPNW